MDAVIQSLRDRHKLALERMETLLKAAERASRDFSPVETAEFTSLRDDARQLDERIAELEEQRSGQRPGDAAHRRLGAGSRDSSGLTYSRGGEHSYFIDLILRQVRQDVAANERILQHRQEIGAELERRDLTRVDGAGGEFVPPLWLMDDYAAFARAGRVTADRMNQIPLPPGTDSINVPRVTTGTLTGVQTADNAAVAEQDAVTAGVVAPVRTIAGQQDVAIQLLEQSPINFDEVIFRDLIADYGKQLDAQVINGSGAAGQLQGLLGTAGIIAVTYTDATPTVAEIYPKIADAISQMASQRFLPPNAIVMHPRRWAWFLAALDTQQRPLVVPVGDGPMNAAGVGLGMSEEGPVGRLHGLPVFIDANIPTNLGAGTNEDRVILLRGEDHPLFESEIRTRVLPEVGSGTLTVRLQVYNYAAFTAARYPTSTAVISGTGLIAPVF